MPRLRQCKSVQAASDPRWWSRGERNSRVSSGGDLGGIWAHGGGHVGGGWCYDGVMWEVGGAMIGRPCAEVEYQIMIIE